MTLRSAQIRDERQRLTAQFAGQEQPLRFSPGSSRWGGPAGRLRRRGAGADEAPAARPAPSRGRRRSDLFHRRLRLGELGELIYPPARMSAG